MSRSVNQQFDAPTTLNAEGAPCKFHKYERDRQLHITQIDAAARYKLQGSNDPDVGASSWVDILTGLGAAIGYTDIPDGYSNYRLVCTTAAGGATTTKAYYLAESVC